MKITNKQEIMIKDLISKMTIEEKIGQLNQESVSIVGGFDLPFSEIIELMTEGKISQDEFLSIIQNSTKDYHEDEIRQGLVSSMMLQDAKEANRLQKIAVEESRLGIPLIIGLDVIHGFRTVFPIALAEAGSFNRDLLKETARMAAKESRKVGIHWHFGPMLDISRDPRWGRVSEGSGEDPYLVSEFAKAKVEGLQGDTSSHLNYVAACLKHYVGYGACEAGRDYNTVTLSEADLRNVYLAPFRAALDAGAATVMSAFNDLNGVPITVNREILTEKLRNEFGFEGFVVSDANAIRECVAHGIVEDEYQAGVAALNAGLDMDMGTNIYSKQIKDALEKGDITIETLDKAVERVLRVKAWLGLFEHPYVEEKYEENISESNRKLALKSAEESIVLLKNENDVLPLAPDTKISIIGELADLPSEVVGAWSISFQEKDCVSIKDGVTNNFKNAKYFEVGGLNKSIDKHQLNEAINYGDVIFVVAGELVSMSGEAASRANINLPGQQSQLIELVAQSEKTIVTLFMNGRPLTLEKEISQVGAALEGWHLGIEMGNAVANTLIGRNNPSAKLTISFPRAVGQCPIYYNHFSTGRPAAKSKFTSKYLDVENGPLFSFGYGLSYSNFEFKNVSLEQTKDSIVVALDVFNNSELDGQEVVQLYMRDRVGSLVRPVKELKEFKKVKVMAHQTEKVQIELNKDQLGFWNNQGVYCLEDGEFIFTISNGVNQEVEFSCHLNF